MTSEPLLKILRQTGDFVFKFVGSEEQCNSHASSTSNGRRHAGRRATSAMQQLLLQKRQANKTPSTKRTREPKHATQGAFHWKTEQTIHSSDLIPLYLFGTFRQTRHSSPSPPFLFSTLIPASGRHGRAGRLNNRSTPRGMGCLPTMTKPPSNLASRDS